MKRWLFLLAVPYVVQPSSGNKTCFDGYGQATYCIQAFILDSQTHMVLRECPTTEFCKDEASALNEAHERRLCKHPIINCADESTPTNYMGDGLGHGPTDTDTDYPVRHP